jgi:hypothetical protein
MKQLSFATIGLLLSIGVLGHAQSYDQGYDSNLDRFLPVYQHSPSHLIKYYKPTQTFYGKGFVVRYGYKTTTPSAAGYIATMASPRSALNEYLTVTNAENRKDITLTKSTVKLPAKEDLQSKRDVQLTQPKAAETKVEPKAEPKTAPSEPAH